MQFADVALAQSGQSNGQIVKPEDIAREAIRQQEARIEEQRKKLQVSPDVLKAGTDISQSFTLPTESTCFVLREIQITSDYRSNFNFLQAIADRFLGQCAGVNGLRQIVSVLDSVLLEKAYVTTRVSLPRQNLAEGKLELFLHVGRIADVKMIEAGDATQALNSDWGTWKNAFPISKDQILNVRDLEQGVEQMTRLPSQVINTKIEPGDAANTSVILIERQPIRFNDRVHGGITLDNSGSQTLGRAQSSSYLSLDNPLGFNDMLTVNAGINLQNPNNTHRSQSVFASYSIPWGYHHLNISLSNNQFAQMVQGTTTKFLSSGGSHGLDAKWNTIFWRSASTKVSAFVGISTRRASSFLDDVELLVQRRRTSSAEIGFSTKTLFEQGSFNFEAYFKRGVSWFDAQADFEKSDESTITLRPRIFNFNAAFQKSFLFASSKTPVQYSLNLRGQYTSDNTLSIDQISIGGRSSVRGFDGDSVLLAESGLVLRNDFSTALQTFFCANNSLYFAVDYGRIAGKSARHLQEKSLSGTAIGMRTGWKNLYVDFSVGYPLSAPKIFQTRRINPYLSMTYSM
ncbi:ShlB/FhaC/HecB family hemolysin secretion/activation protein [Undibacterium danionis]|uniref:ShlB/FhaC/HecB family hemolysin secretion/activation protein n=1 Tax=Undibacterium danionis TaxID=1812100 RepID=A0ABV6IFU7_9BURK